MQMPLAACNGTSAAGRLPDKAQLRSRRSKILADTAARLLEGQDPDLEVMPALYQALVEERIVDATLGFVATDLDQTMTLGFMEGFDAAMVQRCLSSISGRRSAAPSRPRVGRCTSPTSNAPSTPWPTSSARPESPLMPASR